MILFFTEELSPTYYLAVYQLSIVVKLLIKRLRAINHSLLRIFIVIVAECSPVVVIMVVKLKANSCTVLPIVATRADPSRGRLGEVVYLTIFKSYL